MQDLEDINEQDQWLNEQAPKLILFARQWVPTNEDAEDVFHSAFIRFWRRRERVNNPIPFLYSCVRTTAINWCRARGRRDRHERSIEPQPLFQTDRDKLADAETDKAIERAILALDEQQREVVVMRIWGELTFPQIGEVLGVSSSTADTRYRSALKVLHTELDRKIDQ